MEWQYEKPLLLLSLKFKPYFKRLLLLLLLTNTKLNFFFKLTLQNPTRSSFFHVLILLNFLASRNHFSLQNFTEFLEKAQKCFYQQVPSVPFQSVGNKSDNTHHFHTHSSARLSRDVYYNRLLQNTLSTAM